MENFSGEWVAFHSYDAGRYYTLLGRGFPVPDHPFNGQGRAVILVAIEIPSRNPGRANLSVGAINEIGQSKSKTSMKKIYKFGR